MSGSEYVELTLDKPRKLRYTWRSIRRLHNEYGVNILDMKEESFTNPDTISKILWAGLVWDDPDLTVDALDDLIELRQLATISGKVSEAISTQMGETSDPTSGSDSTPTPSD